MNEEKEIKEEEKVTKEKEAKEEEKTEEIIEPRGEQEINEAERTQEEIIEPRGEKEITIEQDQDFGFLIAYIPFRTKLFMYDEVTCKEKGR